MIILLFVLFALAVFLWLRQLFELVQDEINYSKLLKVKDNQDVMQLKQKH